MPRKKQEEAPDSALVSAAKTIGTAAGKIAQAVGVTPAPPKVKAKVGKLPKKNKARLPRRQKKAMRKAGQSGKGSRG